MSNPGGFLGGFALRVGRGGVVRSNFMAPDGAETVFTNFCARMAEEMGEIVISAIRDKTQTADNWRKNGITPEALGFERKHFNGKYHHDFRVSIGTSKDFIIHRDGNGNYHAPDVNSIINDRLWTCVRKYLPKQLEGNVNLIRGHGDLVGGSKKDYTVVIKPIDYPKGLLKSFLFDNTLPESASSVCVLYRGVPIVSVIVAHNGHVLTADGSQVRRYYIDHRSESKISGYHIVPPFTDHIHDGSFVNDYRLITRGGATSAKIAELLSRVMDRLSDISGDGSYEVLRRAGPYRVFELLRQLEEGAVSAIGLTGKGFQFSALAPCVAAMHSLGGEVWSFGGNKFDIRTKDGDMPGIAYGEGALLREIASGLGWWQELKPAFSASNVNEARYAVTAVKMAERTLSYPALVVASQTEEMKLDNAIRIFHEEAFESSLSLAAYLMAVVRETKKVAELPEAERKDFLKLLELGELEELGRDIRLPSKRIVVVKKDGHDEVAQPVTTVDITADTKVWEEKLRCGSSLAEILKEYCIQLLTEEGPKKHMSLLPKRDLVVLVDGLDNTGGFIELLCSILKIPHPTKGIMIAPHKSQGQVTVNQALLYKGQPIEGILVAPLREEKGPVVIRTWRDEQGRDVVIRVAIDENAQPDEKTERKIYAPISEVYKPTSELKCCLGYNDKHTATVKSILEAGGYLFRHAPAAAPTGAVKIEENPDGWDDKYLSPLPESSKINRKLFTLDHSTGQERILSLFNGSAQLVFNDAMMSWDTGASVAIARRLGYDIAILPDQGYMNDIEGKPVDHTSTILDYRTDQKMPATVIGHPGLLRELGLVPQLDLIRLKQREVEGIA